MLNLSEKYIQTEDDLVFRIGQKSVNTQTLKEILRSSFSQTEEMRKSSKDSHTQTTPIVVESVASIKQPELPQPPPPPPSPAPSMPPHESMSSSSSSSSKAATSASSFSNSMDDTKYEYGSKKILKAKSDSNQQPIRYPPTGVPNNSPLLLNQPSEQFNLHRNKNLSYKNDSEHLNELFKMTNNSTFANFNRATFMNADKGRLFFGLGLTIKCFFCNVQFK
jgi:hypothetical protein